MSLKAPVFQRSASEPQPGEELFDSKPSPSPQIPLLKKEDGPSATFSENLVGRSNVPKTNLEDLRNAGQSGVHRKVFMSDEKPCGALYDG